MITPMPTRVRFSDEEMFKDIPYITCDKGADIAINDPQNKTYNISYHFPVDDADEVWVDSLKEKIECEKADVLPPIFILTEDKELLPYCMKDRLVSLQDAINKEKK